MSDPASDSSLSMSGTAGPSNNFNSSDDFNESNSFNNHSHSEDPNTSNDTVEIVEFGEPKDTNTPVNPYPSHEHVHYTHETTGQPLKKPIVKDHFCQYPECRATGKAFSCRHNLDQHVREKHLKLRPYQCLVCLETGKVSTFPRPWGLNRHLEQVHAIKRDSNAVKEGDDDVEMQDGFDEGEIDPSSSPKSLIDEGSPTVGLANEEMTAISLAALECDGQLATDSQTDHDPLVATNSTSTNNPPTPAHISKGKAPVPKENGVANNQPISTSNAPPAPGDKRLANSQPSALQYVDSLSKPLPPNLKIPLERNLIRHHKGINCFHCGHRTYCKEDMLTHMHFVHNKDASVHCTCASCLTLRLLGVIDVNGLVPVERLASSSNTMPVPNWIPPQPPATVTPNIVPNNFNNGKGPADQGLAGMSKKRVPGNMPFSQTKNNLPAAVAHQMPQNNPIWDKSEYQDRMSDRPTIASEYDHSPARPLTEDQISSIPQHPQNTELVHRGDSMMLDAESAPDQGNVSNRSPHAEVQPPLYDRYGFQVLEDWQTDQNVQIDWDAMIEESDRLVNNNPYADTDANFETRFDDLVKAQQEDEDSSPDPFLEAHYDDKRTRNTAPTPGPVRPVRTATPPSPTALTPTPTPTATPPSTPTPPLATISAQACPTVRYIPGSKPIRCKYGCPFCSSAYDRWERIAKHCRDQHDGHDIGPKPEK